MSTEADGVPALFGAVEPGATARRAPITIAQSRPRSRSRTSPSLFGLTASGVSLNIEPLDATFRDSHRAPLHSWYPYLEGYSPRFVEQVRQAYLPNAGRILEPFAGSGTTPIVLGQMGVKCAFSEANPAMAFVARTKLAVLAADEGRRAEIASAIRRIASTLPERLPNASADQGLQRAYERTFGSSEFFDPANLDAALRLRAVGDDLGSADPLVADCFSVAVLASLIPGSRLKRAGDLRYRTRRELDAGTPPLLGLVIERLGSQASDLDRCTGLSAVAEFSCAEAVQLREHVGQGWDGVITSPPYLNGTNYIRNARLELWYLRYLLESSDLRRLRNIVITSGINDVHAGTRCDVALDGVARTVRAIELATYDLRIAKMVAGYFCDMTRVLESLRLCLAPGGRMCIDIGDSVYNGVHVPTDDLLVEVAQALGFSAIERVHLRDRISKSGAKVRQQLLVFELPRRVQPNKMSDLARGSDERNVLTSSGETRGRHHHSQKWERFKKDLPHQSLPYSKRDWGGPSHSMCSYQGKIKPALAHHLIDCFSVKGQVVTDPFSGAGTIPLEACRMGRRGFGIDIARLGFVLTMAKVARPDRARLQARLDDLENWIDAYRATSAEVARAATVRFNSPIPEYFHPETLRQILAARSYFLTNWGSGAEWAVLCACSLHLLHGNRPYALSRRSHPVTPFKPTGEFEQRDLLPRLRDKVARLIESFDDPSREWGGASEADCTAPWPSEIPIADVIITSPPFFDSTRFYMTNWMRYWFVGWERSDFDTRTRDFVETRQKSSLDVYRHFFLASRQRIRDGGLMVLHLGQSRKCDMGAELTTRTAPWFEAIDVFTEGVEHCESHGIRDKGTVSGHTYLVLRAT